MPDPRINYKQEGIMKIQTLLVARHIRNGKEIGKRIVKNRVITDVFVQDIVDNLISPTGTFGDYKYHDTGTGTGGETPADTGLGIPCGETRDTGTQTEGASPNIYKSVATHVYAGTFAITEHGLFDTGTGGILMDRTKFVAINVLDTDEIEFTFIVTFQSGG